MTRDCIEDIKIEKRGDPQYWNITMMVVPKPGTDHGRVPCYDELVAMATEVLADAKKLGKDWAPSHADVMAWSSNHMPDGRGISAPHRYRVTLDMTRNGEWGDPDAD